MAALESARQDFASVVGDSRVSTDAAACAAYAVDGVVPKLVVHAASAEHAAQVLRSAADRALAVIPCRNGTKLATGNPPRRYDIALSLKDLNQVWHYEPADLTLSVEPGMKLGDLQKFLARRGLWLPLDPPGGERASIGGILATNGAGPLRLAYGAPRDLVLGMKIATTDGKVVKTGGRVVKNVAGYDMAKLLIGSYGTLGVIVEASFKLHPLPADRRTFRFSVERAAQARALSSRILASSLEPLRMAYFDLRALEPNGRSETELWVEAGGQGRVMERYEREFAALAKEAGAPSGAAADAERGWARLADAADWIPNDVPAVVVKVTLPLSVGEEFAEQLRKKTAEEGIQAGFVVLGGVGIVRAAWRDAHPAPDTARIIGGLRDAAASFGGALVIERATREVKARIDVWGPVGDDFELMKRLKNTWDPKGVLSPGRFVGGL